MRTGNLKGVYNAEWNVRWWADVGRIEKWAEQKHFEQARSGDSAR